MPNLSQFKNHEDYLIWYRKYRKKNKDKLKKYQKEWRKENKYRWNDTHKKEEIAQGILGRNVRSGKIERKPCILCGDERSEGHHIDYDKPLEVIWLCKIHHKARHKEERFNKILG